MCLPPVSRVPRVVSQLPAAAKQQEHQQQQQQQQQQEPQQANICELDLVAPLPELFLKNDFLPEVLLADSSASDLSSPGSCVVPASSPSSSSVCSPDALNNANNNNNNNTVDLSWFDQELLASFDPLPLVEEQQPTSAAYQLFVPTEEPEFPGASASYGSGMVGEEDDDQNEDDEDDEDEDDFGLGHLQSPGSISASGSDSKARKNKSKNRKRKLACDLSADELAKTREINRIAAQRHRQAAKAKRVDRQRRFDEMGKRNELLREQVRDMTAELKTLRRLVIDMYSPSGARHIPMQQSSLPMGMDFSFLGMA